MNPWRKHRRQRVRRQNGGSYIEQMVPVSVIVNVHIGPMVCSGTYGIYVPQFEKDADFIAWDIGIDFTKPRLPLRDASEFYEIDSERAAAEFFGS